ncbi:Ig-like domain-containing protein [Leifsonia sp. NPDC058230]|uniref:Ig-like domain-containing protein n=1 Tax=Leifsonia sp. NPDC058230 TaxID=3346391 RepID=UPI0036DDC5F9
MTIVQRAGLARIIKVAGSVTALAIAISLMEPDQSSAAHTPQATGSLEVTTGTRVADGVATHTATVSLTTHQGKPIARRAVVIQLPGQRPVHVETDRGGNARAGLTSTIAGMQTVSAYAIGVPRFEERRVEFIAGSPSEKASALSHSGGSRPADGRARHRVEIQVSDRFGNPVAGVDVDISSTPGAILSHHRTKTGSGGTAHVDVASSVAGDFVVAARWGTIPLGDVEVSFHEPSVDPERSSLSVASDVVSHGDDRIYLLTARVLDVSGNPKASARVTFHAAPGLVLTANSALTDSDGIATTTAVAATGNTYFVSAAVGGEQLAAVSVPGIGLRST